jgi:uncharacterized protein YciI
MLPGARQILRYASPIPNSGGKRQQMEGVMPLFVYRGRDSARGLELRKQHREKHLAHISVLDAAGRIRFAGPLIDPDQNPCGSLVVLEAESLEAAREIAEQDPYMLMGIFETVEVFETKAVFPGTAG